MINNKSTFHINVNKRNLSKKTIFIFLIGSAFSQSFAQYEIKKYTINSGGAHMTGGQYELKSSIGQVDASNALSSTNYSINGGFWHENTDLIFKNGFE